MSGSAPHSRPPRVPALDGPCVEVEVRGPVVSADRAWSLVGDTDWLNRVAGNGMVLEQRMEGAADGLPILVGALGGPAGLSLPFEEAWTSWVKERWFHQVRRVDSPLLRGSSYRAELEQVDGGVRPRIHLQLHGRSLARPVLAGVARKVGARWQQALDALAQPPQPRRRLPAAADEALLRWSQRADATLVDRFRELLLQASPTSLRRMRPLALADQWELEADQVVDAMLHGVMAGALELYWSVRCVRCYGQVGGGALLSDLADHAACPSCRLEFDNDLGGNVEVLLTPHPAVVERVDELYCTLYPAGAPEHLAVWTVGPEDSAEEQLTLPAGRLHLGPGGMVPDTRLQVRTEASEHELSWSASAPPDAAVLGSGPARIRLANDSAGRLRVQLTRDGGNEPRLAASALTTRPLFRRHFGHQVLAPDLRLATRSVALLFTDLSGSTAMYEALGDAQAFAVVRDHFKVLRQAVEGCGGVVVKTIGDAVMAAFDTPARATRAALLMQADFAAWVAELGMESPPGLRVGVHAGPALAVHSDVSGLDWFGGTVNLAARAEGLAQRGQIILTDSAAQDGEVVRLLAEEGLQAHPVEHQVKGFRGVQRFVTLRPADSL